MAVRTTPKTESVARCVPRQDGGYMIVTRKGATGSSPVAMHEGAAVLIRDGQAWKPGA